MQNITESSKKTNKTNTNNIAQYIYKLDDGKLVRVANPNYDPSSVKQALHANINEYNQLSSSEKHKYLFKNDRVIKGNPRLSKIFKLSMQARRIGWQRQKERARTTPGFITLSISQEQVRIIIEDLRNKLGKDNDTFNACLAVLYELIDIGRKGQGWIYIAQRKLAKRLGFVRETINRAIDTLKELGLLITHKSHYCPNIIQLSNQLISPLILRLLAAFSFGRSYFQLRDVTQNVNYDIINNNNNKLDVEFPSKKEESNQVNPKGVKFLQDLFKSLKISTPVLCPDTKF